MIYRLNDEYINRIVLGGGEFDSVAKHMRRVFCCGAKRRNKG